MRGKGQRSWQGRVASLSIHFSNRSRQGVLSDDFNYRNRYSDGRSCAFLRMDGADSQDEVVSEAGAAVIDKIVTETK